MSCTQINTRAVNFWDTVTNTYHIDLSAFALPGGCTEVEFSCVDPIFVWITCCNALHKRGIPLQWNPKVLRHPTTGEEMYGAGIQYSKFIRAAYKNIYANGKVALFNINWDGGSTGFGSRSCTPIHVQVMNTNSLSTLAVGLVGYMPYIHVPEGYRSKDNFKAARHHVLQVGTFITGHTYASPSTHKGRTVYAQINARLRDSCITVYAQIPARLRHLCITVYTQSTSCLRDSSITVYTQSTTHLRHL